MDRLFELLLGRSPPSAGTIRLAGVDRADRYSLSRKAGILFLKDALYKRRSPLANLSLHSRLYGLGGAALVFVLSARWFVHWDLALWAAFLGAAFAVGLGLLLGALCENPAIINLWMLVAIMALLAPVLLVGLGHATLPAWVESLDTGRGHGPSGRPGDGGRNPGRRRGTQRCDFGR